MTEGTIYGMYVQGCALSNFNCNYNFSFHRLIKKKHQDKQIIETDSVLL